MVRDIAKGVADEAVKREVRSIAKVLQDAGVYHQGMDTLILSLAICKVELISTRRRGRDDESKDVLRLINQVVSLSKTLQLAPGQLKTAQNNLLEIDEDDEDEFIIYEE